MSDHGLPTTRNKVQELQRTLYRAAKADPRRRFHALYDKVYRRDILERAWEQVRRNRGAAGIDGVTLAEVERYGVERLLDELAAELKEESYRVKPSRRVWIPKPGRAERRPLSIPSVRDRIVQAALKLVAEPVFEAGFLPCSFGFRPKRATHDALQVLIDEAWRGRRWVVETDIASCFESIPHDRLMAAVEDRICDRKLLRLVRAMLRAGVMESGAVKHSVTGTPQGGVVSPLLANVYLAPAGPGMGGAGPGCVGALRRRPRGALPEPGGSGAGSGPAARPARRARSGVQGGEDAHRAPDGGRRGARLPRLRTPLGTHEAPQARPVPRTLALTASDAAGA